MLGLSIDLAAILDDDRPWVGLVLAALLIVVIRPVLVGLVLWPVRLSRGERGFVLFSGLKGAVPILLGTYVLVEGGRPSRRDLPHHLRGGPGVGHRPGRAGAGGRAVLRRTYAGHRTGTLGARHAVPRATRRAASVRRGTRLARRRLPLADLDVGESFWVSMVGRDGRLVQVRGDTVLRAGDEVLALAEDGDSPDHVFTVGRPDVGDISGASDG